VGPTYATDKEVIMSKSGIKFEDPPNQREQRYDWAAIAADLRKRPGKWAKIFDRDKTTYVSAFYQGLKDLPVTEFEVRVSNTDRGITKADAENLGLAPVPRTCTMYLRYNPNKESA
jgi:hypothetical protein